MEDYFSVSPFPGDPDGLIFDTGLGPCDAAKRCRELVSRIIESAGADLGPLLPAAQAAPQTGRGTGPVLVVKTASHPWEVLDDWALEKVFRDREVRRCLYMPLGYPITLADGVTGTDRRSGFPAEDFTGDFPGLIRKIAACDAETIHLQVSPHTKSEFLVPLVRQLRPDCRLSVEFYDMGALFSRRLLSEANGYEPDAINMTRFAAWVAVREARAVVVKSSGADWERLAAQFSATTVSWFPMARRLTDVLPSRGSESHVERRVAFAGSLGDTELVRGRETAPGANFLETLAQIMSGERCRLTVFNAADRRGEGPAADRFRRVEDWFRQFGDRADYHAAVGEEALLAQLADHDFGFFCVHYPGQRVEHVGRLAISNRVMAYLCAGLPVIVDAYAEATADLIRSFNAGIVVDPSRYADLPLLIQEADLDTLRNGARRLREHIVSRNAASLEVLRSALKVDAGPEARDITAG